MFVVRIKDSFKKVLTSSEEEALKHVQGEEVIGKITTSEYLQKEKAYDDYFRQLAKKKYGENATN